MDPGNQPCDVPLILTKNQKFLETFHRMFMKYIKVIIRDYLLIFGYQMDHFSQKVHFFVKMASGNQPGGVPLIQKKKSKIVKSNQQNVHELHQCNYQGLFINLVLLGGSFWQKFHFLVKMDSRNQPSDVPLILTKK